MLDALVLVLQWGAVSVRMGTAGIIKNSPVRLLSWRAGTWLSSCWLFFWSCLVFSASLLNAVKNCFAAVNSLCRLIFGDCWALVNHKFFAVSSRSFHSTRRVFKARYLHITWNETWKFRIKLSQIFKQWILLNKEVMLKKKRHWPTPFRIYEKRASCIYI